MEKFSLIVCNYNNGKFFDKCFESIENQTYPNIEVIIIDDCSTDDSETRIKQLIGNNPKYTFIKNEKNSGYAFTLDKGIRLATGKYIARVDPDDAIEKNAIEESLKYYTSPKIIATYSQIYICDGNLVYQNIIYPRTRKIKNNQLHFFNINNEVSHFFTFKRAVYDTIQGINTTLTSSVDFDLYLKLYEKGEFAYVPKPLYYYRQHQGGISQNNAKKLSVHKNWNTVLFDTCQRRGISEIGNTPITKDTQLSTLIFEKENTIAAKIKRYITKKMYK